MTCAWCNDNYCLILKIFKSAIFDGAVSVPFTASDSFSICANVAFLRNISLRCFLFSTSASSKRFRPRLQKKLQSPANETKTHSTLSTEVSEIQGGKHLTAPRSIHMRANSTLTSTLTSVFTYRKSLPDVNIRPTNRHVLLILCNGNHGCDL